MVEWFEIKGEIFLWNIGNKSKNSVVWGILQKKTMNTETEFEVQEILPWLHIDRPPLVLGVHES